MKYSVQCEGVDGTTIELDLGPGAPRLSSVDLTFTVHTPDELASAITALGFEPFHMSPSQRFHSRTVPITNDAGEAVERLAVVSLAIGTQLMEAPSIPALAAIVAEAAAFDSGARLHA